MEGGTQLVEEALCAVWICALEWLELRCIISALRYFLHIKSCEKASSITQLYELTDGRTHDRELD